MTRLILALVCLHVLSWTGLAGSPDPTPAGGQSLLSNGDFNEGIQDWNPLWASDPSAVKGVLDTAEHHGSTQSLRIQHTGDKDWSLGHTLNLKVQAGEIYELTAWVRVQGTGTTTLGVVTRDTSDHPINWAFGAAWTAETNGWRFLRSRFVIPPGVSSIWPRLIGDGPATVWCDGFSLTRQGSLAALRALALPVAIAIRNKSLEITLHTADATFAVKDLRSGHTWTQRVQDSPVIVLAASATGEKLDITLLDPIGMRQLTARAALDADGSELLLSIHAAGDMTLPLCWPSPFLSSTGQLLIVPVNEGISYPTDDQSLPEMNYVLYGGHGICMPWYGTVEGDTGWMAIIETPDDASLSIHRRDGLLQLAPEWEPQKQHFGPDRVIRYVFVKSGGYVAMAKRYRQYAIKTGLFKTLADKRKTTPAVDLLVGAVNIWCWDEQAVAWCHELQSLGIQHILWSNALPGDQIKALNSMGVLTSRYDIYQDAMDPQYYPVLHYVDRNWTSDAWKNRDLMIGADGQWVRGWQVETKDGRMIPCGTLCDREALAYAQRRIPADLANHAYRCRFIDTTTASPWRECYDPVHPMTRSDSKHYKMELLRYVSQGCGLVCGSETGHDAAVPFVDYFEGMLSIAPYRVPDSGRDMARMWEDVPAPVARFQTGHTYRLPLWELVYHDCVVAQWYWGDYNNKLPKLWDRRDLWNALYGTPPMFMFDRKTWEANKDRFVKSYQTAEPVARATGYSEMLSHEWLTPDHAVQRTRFANGVTVTVNFGDTPATLSAPLTLPPLGYRIDGLKL
jgi:hypothetical protein